jgi:hypothetical protein
MDVLINANPVPKLVKFLLCQQVSQMFECFPYFFFTNHGFVILALICNLNLHGLSPTLHQQHGILDQTKAVVSAAAVAGLISLWACLIKLWILW